jgi:hypothetical protein
MYFIVQPPCCIEMGRDALNVTGTEIGDANA